MSERRRQQRFSEAHPAFTAVDGDMPWNSVIRESADNVEFWLNELQEPALLYTQIREELAAPVKEWPRKWEKGGKGKGAPKSDQQVRHTTNASGQELCINFNRTACKWAECNRAHQCFYCLGQHPGTECNRKRNLGKKGKGTGKSKKSDAASSGQ